MKYTAGKTKLNLWKYLHQPEKCPTMMPRHDRETATLIDFSIGILGSHGIYVAARLLCERGVSFETVCRVLRKPGQRRLPLRS
ncbi:hypothetical protein [Pseudoduganella umbonata]|uniref:Uncharacterized protein n=1 Tax=Pseudoduganella umbonata TaxID=864828 RepID=A0A4P8HJ41_9BURK|nr:hypothetical protein [Pseudoduganella umbonata]MBB3219527.1 hypothetical protein [Pseudoduganella umbonata]QCP09603.1 hypothetical protein FCL38_03585 [Pseudoduganella umbonata]